MKKESDYKMERKRMSRKYGEAERVKINTAIEKVN